LQTTIGAHLPEETLMGYASGLLTDRELSDLEEHILMCEVCQLQLEAVDEHLRSAAEAAREIREEERLRKKARASSWQWGNPKLLWVGALATVMVATVTLLSPKGTPQVTPAEVSLSASRGAAQALVSHIQAGNIVLKVDTSELPNLPVYRLQVVDGAGREIWSGPVPNVRQHIRVAISHPLRSGQYWVRLFAPDQTQVREFGLVVE
jgi:hypothetical protein